MEFKAVERPLSRKAWFPCFPLRLGRCEKVRAMLQGKSRHLQVYEQVRVKVPHELRDIRTEGNPKLLHVTSRRRALIVVPVEIAYQFRSAGGHRQRGRRRD
jgi:hypothetical protein